MKKTTLLSAIYFFLILTFFYADASGGDRHGSATEWKAGVARVDITPQEPMWLRGYAGRDRASEGKLHSLWVKALSLEDAEGRLAVLVTMDLGGMKKDMSDAIKDRLHEEYNLSQSQIILSSSHTHSGPVIRDEVGYDVYNLDQDEIEKIERYSAWLEDMIFTTVSNSMAAMEPVQLSSGNGVARFAVNRRQNNEANLSQVAQLAGPVDHAVPVIKVTKKSGELLALVFGYACHATVLNQYEWSGDYPGFAQIALEERFPGTTAMFFAGSGGDQNPLPRRTVGLARQYGNTLAAAVERVINEPMRELESCLITKYREIDLSYTTPPTNAALENLIEESSGYQKQWASRILAKLNQDNALPTTYPYPIQIWRIGEQNMVALGDEVVVDYGIRLKQMLGQDLFVMAYANQVMGYIPSARVLREGGYEGTTSLIYSDRPSTWKADIETKIIHEVLKLAEQAGVPLPESGLIEN